MRYRYHGPFSSATLVVDGQTRDVLLHNGCEIELPEDHDYVRTLTALGWLEPLGPVATPATPIPTPPAPVSFAATVATTGAAGLPPVETASPIAKEGA